VNVVRPPGERLRHPLHHEEVRGSGQEEPPRGAVGIGVDGALHGDEQILRALHLVEGETERARDHGLRFRLGLGAQIEIVQGQEASFEEGGSAATWFSCLPAPSSTTTGAERARPR
jgi:hypothetical protein